MFPSIIRRLFDQGSDEFGSSSDPIRGEILGAERLSGHARRIASRHQLDRRHRLGFPVLERLEENERVLEEAYRRLISAVQRDEAISPAAEWLLDNYHVVEEQIREVRRSLPEGYQRQLPKLTGGELEDHPRVFALSWRYAAHTDSRFAPETLENFVNAYQEVSPLTMGEVWAIPSSLRLVLLENLRRLAQRMVTGRDARAEARRVIEEIRDAAREDGEDVLVPLRGRSLGELNGDRVFVVELVQRLREADPRTLPALGWLEDQARAWGTTIEEMVREEHGRQLAAQATVANIVTSMRKISAFAWREFFEDVSVVERILRRDPSGIYPRCDFNTRDSYRHVVEELARGSEQSELEVARRLLTRTEQAVEAPRPTEEAGSRDPRARYPGYHLQREGRRAFEEELGYRIPLSRRLKRAFMAGAYAGYFGTLEVLTLALLILPLAWAASAGAGTWEMLLVVAAALIPASDLAIAVLHQDVTELVPPERLPKLALEEGVPEELKTVVAVPVLLESAEDVREEVGRLEERYLANSRGHLIFALLSDWTDAPEEHMPEDERLLGTAAAAIGELNKRHGPAPDGRSRFLLLHRHRVWSETEGCWMGWERKRGKLEELNRLLRGDSDTTYMRRDDGLSDVPPDARFVIALDADTRLPPGAARRLVGTAAHPLNCASYDAGEGRVTDGYGILQPRITAVMPPAGEGSRYHRLFSGPKGIDPYSSAASNVYQDLFGQGTFVGKGIYDVDAFEASLEGRVPEGALLSHDHFEGAFARCGLVSDVELFDDYPTQHEVAARRAHRWARGDWQLLPWILGSGPEVEGRDVSPTPPFLSWWKMADNLRRSLSAPAAVALLLVGWLLLPVSPFLWAAFVAATIAVPASVPVVGGLVPRGRDRPLRVHLRGMVREARGAAARAALEVAFLAQNAWLMADAAIRSLVRVYVTDRHLLEWTPAALAGRGIGGGVSGAYRRMWRPVAMAAGTVALVAVVRPVALPAAATLGVVWAASPFLSWWISQPLPVAEPEELSADEREEMRMLARESWRYFEETVDEENSWLPPDNVQEDPEIQVAHRTSPTNVGLYLLSTVAARDFGWIGTRESAERMERTLRALEKLERLDGHLFNWYDTRSLQPLYPRYVSTVDSGNLAGHLLATGAACREMRDGPVPPTEAAAGIRDTVALARQAMEDVAGRLSGGTVSRSQLVESIERVEDLLSSPPSDAGSWTARLEELHDEATTLEDVAAVAAEQAGGEAGRALRYWSEAVARSVASHCRDLPWVSMLDGDAAGGRDRPVDLEPDRQLRALASRAEKFATEMDFSLLYDPERKLFSIGYRVDDDRLDEGYYDLLASEARLASLVAVATGDVEAEHWFHLGRSVTPVNHGAALVSWSGSMFEYLMPYLVMEPPPGTVLEESQRLVVHRQVEYGAERGVPWGVSESAYNARDLEMTYQYSHFGIPGLGLTRGLSEDLVVAPYATALAAMVAPRRALENFRRLEELGLRDEHGFYEAVDFTPSRLSADQEYAVVRAHMAHHQGMTVAALANVIHDGRLRERFHSAALVRSVEMLLQEELPPNVPMSRPRREEVETLRHVREIAPPAERHFDSPHMRPPPTHVLSNGSYSVMVTAAGTGYSRCGELAVTRWREDATQDPWGTFVYLREVESDETWSAGWQPTGAEPDDYRATFSESRAEIHRRDGAISTTMEVVVSPEEDGELRRITLRNHGSRPRVVELTSYAEVVLAPPEADRAHPAFQKLFVQTDVDPATGALLATRRRRSQDEERIWATHVSAVEGETVGSLQYETDRARFLDRGRDTRSPAAVSEGRPLSNTTGSVLDPVFSLRRTVRVRPGQAARVTFTTQISGSRQEAVNRAGVHRDPAAFERAAGLAWTQAQVQLQHLGVAPEEAHLFQRLASRLLYLDSALRPDPGVASRNGRGQSALWRYGISGDRPIVLVRISQTRDRDLVRQLLRAHEYWGWKGLEVDLVILNEHPVTYIDELQDWIQRLIRVTEVAGSEDHAPRGEVHALRADEVEPSDQELLRSTARVVLEARNGSLSEQLEAARPEEVPEHPPARVSSSAVPPEAPPRRPDLQFYNGLGGFAEGGREYVITLGEGQWTPAPWVNVVANARFGFVASESGGGFTWAENSQANRLTPWSNDPVSDRPGEVMYVRDEVTGELWTPTPLPIRETTPYRVTHSQGWTRYEHRSRGVELELTQFVPVEDPVKISRLRLRNTSGRARHLSVTAYVEWVLGVHRAAAALHLETWRDDDTGALLARNTWNEEFASRVAFADLRGEQEGWIADRTEFLGRNGSLASPAALAPDAELSDLERTGADPCAALRRPVRLEPGESAEVVFLLGQGADEPETLELVGRYREADPDAVLDRVRTRWDDILATVQVDVPDRSMEPMVNRWLQYQALSCRLFARTAFYQSGGAYGFRDQLQDVMALTVSRRDLAREHLLRAAAHQFEEGDVQHWWHPPSGRGVRTRIADDLLWLPFATLHYLQVTGDESVLDEEVPFLKGPALEEGEQERYFEPDRSEEVASLYEHCARAVDARLETGPHGLPLMGAGDWNDGMNRVGHRGRGESVWMGWFLHLILGALAPVARERGEEERAERWLAHRKSLGQALERHGWDGDWYRRAYFDDGTPLGSAENEECRIDSIAQSWAVISGAARPARQRRAMQSVEQYLVRRGDALVLLFTPPFDRAPVDPGYIRGYVPGVRENGGQYTHAAIWSVIAFAELGQGDEAAELFSILNPVNQAGTRAGAHRYKVEPYVSVGDVYSEPPHAGRGGWSWYTGSAGWMYRAGVEWILGFRLRGDRLRLDPCIPRDWPGFSMTFRYHSSRYEIEVESPGGAMRGVARAELDGQAVSRDGDGSASLRVDDEGAWIPLTDDGETHRIRVVLEETDATGDARSPGDETSSSSTDGETTP